MEQHTLAQHLEQYLQQRNATDEGVQAGNKHVFQACMEHLEPQLNFEQKMVLMDYHVCYTNALEGARSGNLAVSQHWLDKAEALPDFESPQLQRVVDINKHPAVAYHVYRAGDHEEAIQLLRETIQISGDIVHKDGLPYLIWGQMEDYINIFRVHCTAKEGAKALQYAQSILLAAVHGQHTPGVLDDVSSELLQEGAIDFISYATSDVIVRLLKMGQWSNQALLHQLLHPLWDVEDWSHCPLAGYEEAIKAMRDGLEESPTFAEALVAALPLLHRQSPALQFFLLETAMTQLKESLPQKQLVNLQKAIGQYYVQNAEVDHYLLGNHSQLTFQMSNAH